MQVSPDWRQAPVLTGVHVRLEPLSLAHADSLLKAADDDEVFAHLKDSRPRSSTEAEQLVRKMLALCSSGERVTWAQLDASGAVAGTTSYLGVDPVLRTLEIGATWIGRAWWRTGVNTEAKLLLLRHAFETLGAVRVTWQTDIRNERSQAAIARLGARREGVLRKNRLRKGGGYRDSVLFAMTDDDWPAARERLISRLTEAA
jgi:RimJ/RimL family protein N-acetyltransferase